jgi:two-component system chemotaxis response regulator CheY
VALNVLIVDDSSLTRKKIKRIIQMTGLDVGQLLDAGNGAEALKILGGSSVDLVLADLNMPEMGGAEMIHQMKSLKATKSIPVVVVSTESRTTRIQELLTEGVKNYLHKPFTPEEFKGIIQELWSKPTTEASDLLAKALSQALETMAFLTIIPMEEDLAVPEKTIFAEISFTGPKSGTVQMLTGLDFGKVLAENISGLSKVDDKAPYDALKELSNVTCGLFLPMVVSSTADVFDITVPIAKSCDDSPPWHEFVANQNSHVSNIEGYMLATRLIIENTTMIAQSS